MVQWQVVTRTGSAPVADDLLPDDALVAHEDASGLTWTTAKGHARFRLGSPRPEATLPAGWYELRGRIECLDGNVTLPSLHLEYLREATERAEIPLPDPDAKGALRSLVLFKYPVSALSFCPSVWPSRFRMHGFRLRRISRAAALRLILGGTQAGTAGGRSGTLRRTLGFAARARTQGLTAATDESFVDYLRRQRPQGLSDYDIWIRKYDTLTEWHMVDLRRRAEGCAPGGPTISVLLPLRRMPERLLQRCIESVLAQVYPAWELCVVTDAGIGSGIAQLLEKCATADPRVRIVANAADGTMAAMSNAALGMATGSHVALLDAGDELRPHALLEAVEAIRRDPDVRFVYADEDSIDDHRRSNPYFKPDWNPDLLRSQNYIGHFAVIPAAWVREVGGFRTEVEGAHGHDLFLRCTERLRPSQILHVPHILHHRNHAASKPTVMAADAAADMADAGVRAVREHLQRQGTRAVVEPLPGACFRVRWPLPAQPPKINLVIPTRDRVDLLHTCVESILAKTSYTNFEIVVVDNQSTETATLDYLATLERRDRVRVLRDDAPFNYSAINNRAVAQCDGELVCLVNNDIEVITPDWLEEMAGHAVRPEVGAVGAMLYYPNDTIQHAGVIVGLHGVADHIYAGQPRGYPGHHGRALVAQDLSVVTAACLMVRREVYGQVGGFDERLAVAFNDVDFCLRIGERGYLNVWTPFAQLYHHESATRGGEDTPDRRARFAGEMQLILKRWQQALNGDSAHNPNLSLQSLNCEPAFPPREPWRRAPYNDLVEPRISLS